MKNQYLLLILVVILSFSLNSCNDENINYPKSIKIPVVDTLHGNLLVDNYRWLEDLASSETKNWINNQEVFYNSYFNPYKNEVNSVFNKINNYEKFYWHEPVFQKGGMFFYRRKDPDKKEEIIIRKKNLDEEGEIIFNPSKELRKGESFLGFHDVSDDGRYLAFLPNKGSSSWHSIRIKNIETGKYLDEEIRGIQTIGPSNNVLWDKYSKGFFYLRFITNPLHIPYEFVKRFLLKTFMKKGG